MVGARDLGDVIRALGELILQEAHSESAPKYISLATSWSACANLRHY